MAEIAALGPPLEPHKVPELGPPAGLAAACRDDKGGEDEGSEAGGSVHGSVKHRTGHRSLGSTPLSTLS